MVKKKIAALFAGQGAQCPGMGKDLHEASAAARAVIDSAGVELQRLMFDGPEDALKDTRVTQPAVYTVDLAAWAAFTERPDFEERIEVVGMAGFSLGEYAAFTAAGLIPSFAEGLALVRRRSALMADAGRHGDGSPRGAMAAVIGSRAEVLEAVRDVHDSAGLEARGLVLEAVNFNAPTQTVVAGDAEAIDQLAARAKEVGRKLKIIPLPVSTAFHTEIMRPAAEGIRQAAQDIQFGTPTCPVFLNLTGRPIAEYAGSVDEVMGRQAMSPVYWQETLEAISALGVDAVVEFGPGKALTGFVKKSLPGILAMNVSDVASLEEAWASLTK
ncbi:MAG: ACP S-malonyltransferase [Clostridiales Family XIII bacterium]|jgi:[acyl-carrier-protein] S-malonyltransferase|nr:ACP S-malonyltransferase [Clostridiales Family XIII bacterium]